MCKGGEEQSRGGGFRRSNTAKKVVSAAAAVSCELCSSEASLYCQADDAFLCRTCDRWVHGANFLAQRHIRCLLCSSCRCLTQRYLIGPSSEVVLPTIVSWPTETNGSRPCDAGAEAGASVKKPFLFL